MLHACLVSAIPSGPCVPPRPPVPVRPAVVSGSFAAATRVCRGAARGMHASLAAQHAQVMHRFVVGIGRRRVGSAASDAALPRGRMEAHLAAARATTAGPIATCNTMDTTCGLACGGGGRRRSATAAVHPRGCGGAHPVEVAKVAHDATEKNGRCYRNFSPRRDPTALLIR